MNEPYAARHDAINKASFAAEAVFRKTGHIRPMYHLFLKTGEQAIVPSPHSDKQMATDIMREIMKVIGVEKYVFMDEAWSLESDEDNPITPEEIAEAKKVGIANHPRRVEIVVFSAEDKNGQSLATRKIIRDGDKAALCELIIQPERGIMEGRMIGLLSP